jgi:hypothetical protein
VTSAAYLLFYRRRTEKNHPLGGPILQQLLENAEADSEMPAGSRDPSPVAGEGRRLGDFSQNLNGSSSASGRGHLVGDGGSGLIGPSLGPHRETVHQGGSSLRNSIETPENDDPPIYAYEDTAMMSVPKDSLSPATPEVEDQAIDMDYDQQGSYTDQWGMVEPGWSFNRLNNQAAQPPNSDADDMFAERASMGSNDSTRVEGNVGSDVDEGFEEDNPIFSDAHQEDIEMRTFRESAPAPDYDDLPAVTVSQELDDDDELPVVEIPPPQGT